jgi:N-carbamoylputrescine amidase
VLIVSCDLREVEKSRTHWPFLRDRRIDAYDKLTERFVDAR